MLYIKKWQLNCHICLVKKDPYLILSTILIFENNITLYDARLFVKSPQVDEI